MELDFLQAGQPITRQERRNRVAPLLAVSAIIFYAAPAAAYRCSDLANLTLLPNTKITLAQTYMAGQTVSGTTTAPVGLAFFDEQPGHDGLACARIIGEQEAQRLSRQHLAINGGDLMRQCFDLRCSDGEIRVEEVGEPYSVCLRREPEQATVGIERIAPYPPR
jgi:hypothetical protein